MLFFVVYKETLIKAIGIASDPRKSVTERGVKRFNQRFLKSDYDVCLVDKNMSFAYAAPYSKPSRSAFFFSEAIFIISTYIPATT